MEWELEEDGVGIERGWSGNWERMGWELREDGVGTGRGWGENSKEQEEITEQNNRRGGWNQREGNELPQAGSWNLRKRMG